MYHEDVKPSIKRYIGNEIHYDKIFSKILIKLQNNPNFFFLSLYPMTFSTLFTKSCGDG